MIFNLDVYVNQKKETAVLAFCTLPVPNDDGVILSQINFPKPDNGRYHTYSECKKHLIASDMLDPAEYRITFYDCHRTSDERIRECFTPEDLY